MSTLCNCHGVIYLDCPNRNLKPTEQPRGNPDYLQRLRHLEQRMDKLLEALKVLHRSLCAQCKPWGACAKYVELEVFIERTRGENKP